MKLLIKALAFAGEKHKHQRGDDAHALPYINHPIALVHTLAHEGAIHDETLLCAALLHDTLEYTQTTVQELATAFSPKIAAIVLEVTDDFSQPKAVCQQQQIARAPHLCPEAKLIKLADKICNLRDIINIPPADWDVAAKLHYFDWSAQVIAGLRGIHPPLEAIFDQVYAQRTLIRSMIIRP